MSYRKIFSFVILATIGIATIQLSFAAKSYVIPIFAVADDGQGESLGTVKVEDSICGVLLTPNLHGLTPGIHGFHIHEVASCADKGMAAKGHLDPDKSAQHKGPYDKKGHLGDLPVLIVDPQGNANLPTLAPRFHLAKIKGHSLMIHAGGDNYADQPEKLGGGGERIACGIIEGK